MIGAGRLLNESNLAPAQKLFHLWRLATIIMMLLIKENLVIKYTACFDWNYGSFTLLLSAARKVPFLDHWKVNGKEQLGHSSLD